MKSVSLPQLTKISRKKMRCLFPSEDSRCWVILSTSYSTTTKKNDYTTQSPPASRPDLDGWACVIWRLDPRSPGEQPGWSISGRWGHLVGRFPLQKILLKNKKLLGIIPRFFFKIFWFLGEFGKKWTSGFKRVWEKSEPRIFQTKCWLCWLVMKTVLVK